MGISHTHHINKQTNTNQVFAKLYTLRALQSRVSFFNVDEDEEDKKSTNQGQVLSLSME